MKKIAKTFVFIVSFPTILSAQISLSASDMIEAGDIVVQFVDTTSSITPGNAGANQTWDLSNAAAGETITTQALAPSATNYANDFPNSNLAMTDDNATFFFYEKTANHFSLVGSAGDFIGDGSTMVIPYSSPVLLHNFPRTYNSNSSSTFESDVTVNGTSSGVYQMRIKRGGLMLDTTDGWGTVITPAGTYNSLRVKIITYFTDSLWVKFSVTSPFMLVSATEDTVINYQWFTNGGKLAIADLSVDVNGNVMQYTWTDVSVNIAENIVTDFQVNVYPIPANQSLNIMIDDKLPLNNDYLFEIYDMQGKSQLSTLLQKSKHFVDITNISAGIYTWVLRNIHNQNTVHGKLSIVK